MKVGDLVKLKFQGNGQPISVLSTSALQHNTIMMKLSISACGTFQCGMILFGVIMSWR